MELLLAMPALISALTFTAVIFSIVTERLHLTIAAFLGALLLIFAHVMTLQEAVGYISQSYATIRPIFWSDGVGTRF